MGDVSVSAMQSVWEVREGAHGHLTRIYTEGGGWLVANAEPYVAQHIVTLHNLWLRKLEVGPTEGSESVLSKLEALCECDGCHGRGIIYHGVPGPGESPICKPCHGSGKKQRPCPECGGEGGDPNDPGWSYHGIVEPGSRGPCPRCEGRGTVPWDPAWLLDELIRARPDLRQSESPRTSSKHPARAARSPKENE